ncbi:hypothetical protein JZ751_020073 [Albula glossodonta]|uniref:Uncharacterized protein n=1 Tax=Albula glossodonta TaxID=121402 RepID=A0A8T2NNU0_9TELE|nr:hypothetical protein JZ751_020073 [Albula glossodonta]
MQCGSSDPYSRFNCQVGHTARMDSPRTEDAKRNDEEAVVDRGGTRSLLKTNFEKEELEELQKDSKADTTDDDK